MAVPQYQAVSKLLITRRPRNSAVWSVSFSPSPSCRPSSSSAVFVSLIASRSEVGFPFVVAAASWGGTRSRRRRWLRRVPADASVVMMAFPSDMGSWCSGEVVAGPSGGVTVGSDPYSGPLSEFCALLGSEKGYCRIGSELWPFWRPTCAVTAVTRCVTFLTSLRLSFSDQSLLVSTCHSGCLTECDKMSVYFVDIINESVLTAIEDIRRIESNPWVFDSVYLWQ